MNPQEPQKTTMEHRFSWQITLLPIIFIIFTAGILSALDIFELQQEKEKQIAKATTEFINQQKKMAKDRVMRASELIQFQHNRTEELVRKRVKGRVDEAIHIANAFYERYHATLPREELEEQIKLLLSNAVFDHPDGYYFAVDMATEKIIIHKLDKLVGYSMSQHKDLHGNPVLSVQKKLLSRSDGAFQTVYFPKPTNPKKEFPKQLYIRYFKPFNWLIGTGEYLDDMEKRLQAYVLKRLKALYSGDNDYLFIKKMYNLEGGDGKPYASLILSSNPVHRPGQLLFDTDQDSKGKYFRKEILKLLYDQGEGFVDYWHPSPNHGHEVKKTSFFFYDKTWKWAIGSGFYYDILKKQLAKIGNRINERITKEIWLSIGITLLIIVIMSTIFFVISLSITRTINTYKTKLEQSQKMESIGTLAGGIAHDFNNILSSIIGFTELALVGVKKGSELEDDLHEVENAGMRAKDLVKQILTFARQSDEMVKPLQVSKIATEVIKFIRSSIPATIEIEQNIESDSFIMGSPTQVHQIMMNLCTNSAQAMEEKGGTLDVSVNDTAIGKMSLIPDLKPGEYIKTKVTDTGLGISPKHIHSIFEPYFTTKKAGEGTGMGLSVVHGIVESYGGKIIVDSAVGKGTCFTIYLPITKKKKVHINAVKEDLPTGNENILFVDDEAPIAKMGSKVLEQLGYSVATRTSSVEALELFKSKPQAFDLVITDMTMPNMTGDKLAIELMKVRSNIPVILCTGYSKKLSKKSTAEIGIKALTYKPIVKTDLAKAVRKVLDEAKEFTQKGLL